MKVVHIATEKEKEERAKVNALKEMIKQDCREKIRLEKTRK